MRVFIVEDSDLLRDRITQSLIGVKQIQVIGSAREADVAIKQIQELEPDLILLDIRLQQGNGFQVLETIQALERIPIIVVLTIFAYPQIRQKFLATGADYFFDKSTEFSQALGLIRTLAQSPERSSDPDKKNTRRA